MGILVPYREVIQYDFRLIAPLFVQIFEVGRIGFESVYHCVGEQFLERFDAFALVGTYVKNNEFRRIDLLAKPQIDIVKVRMKYFFVYL